MATKMTVGHRTAPRRCAIASVLLENEATITATPYNTGGLSRSTYSNKRSIRLPLQYQCESAPQSFADTAP